MYIWPDGSVTGSVNHAVLEEYLKAKEAGEDLSAFAPFLGILPEPEPEAVEDSPAAPAPPAGDYVYDPGEHTVAEVNDYLDTASPEETQRVLDAELAGKARKGLVAQEEE
jgi:hypothetical protein